MEIKKIAVIILVCSSLYLTENLISKVEKTLNVKEEVEPKAGTELDISKFIGMELNQSPFKFATRSVETFFETNADNQPVHRNEIDSPDSSRLITQAFEGYIKNIYNSKGYADYISQNCVDLKILLEMIPKFNLGRNASTYAFTAVKLFSDKLKESELTEASMVSKLLKDLSSCLKLYFETQKNYFDSSMLLFKDGLKRTIFKIVRGNVNLDDDTISQYIIEEMESSLQSILDQQEEKIRFQQLIVRFVEHAISKMFWSRTRYETFLPSFIQIGNRILLLARCKIIEHADDYDSLIKSLVCSACRSLDLLGRNFPEEFFDEIEEHIEKGQIPFLEDDEQDDFITTKKEMFIEALAKSKTKALAYHRLGILPELS